METLHVISHTHWDREWYLTYQQFRLKLVHLVDRLLDILDEDADYKYFMLDGQTIVLDDYLQMRPEMEDALRRHIQAGRILIGPWHILPDMFLVSPEAHIRNLLQGARTAQRFGSKMPVGYIPDPFGHPGQVPQILKGFQIEAAALWRGLSDQPAELWWESPDGSKVFLAYLRDSYSNGANLPTQDAEAFAQQISIAGDSLAAHSAVEDHLIMLGTDHMEPSPNTSSVIEYANEHLAGKRVIHSTLPAYLARIAGQIEKMEDALPTIQGELRACDRSPLLPGVLSTRMWIKQRNHYSQNLLEKWAEPFSIFAENMLDGEPHKTNLGEISGSDRIHKVAPIIRQAWRMLMENHPHDSICGCSIDQVHDEMKPRFDQVDQIGEEITLQSLQALSGAVDTQFQEAFSAIVLFNPIGNSRGDQVEVALNVPEDVTAFELVDSAGKVIPHEFLGSSHEELANLVLPKGSLRDTIGAIHEGRVAGMAIRNVKVSREGALVTIDAILDEDGQPNIPVWQQAEKEISRYEGDTGVTHVHVIAHTPQASKIRFASPEIPALGWRTLWVRALESPDASPASEVNPLLKPLLPLALRFAQSPLGVKLLDRLNVGDESKAPFVIENEFFRVEASQADGSLTVLNKNNQVVFTGLNCFVDGGDAGDEYNYCPPDQDSLFSPKVVSLKVYRHRLVPTLEITFMLQVPEKLSPDRKCRSEKMVNIPVTSQVSLVPGVPRVDIHTEIENLAKDHRLRVHFPAPFAVQSAHSDGHFEVAQRPVDVPERDESWVEDPRPEVPQRAFTDISNGKIGLMIANRGLPEVEVITLDGAAQSEIAVTLLRSVGWLSRDDMSVRQGHAGPAFETPGGQVPGKWEFEIAIIPHTGDWLEAYQLAYAFQSPPRVVETGLHAGELPPQGSFIGHSPADFVVSAVKKGEDELGWIVRGYNITSKTIRVKLRPLRRFAQAWQVNLAEQKIQALEIEEDGSVELPVDGHKISTILFSD